MNAKTYMFLDTLASKNPKKTQIFDFFYLMFFRFFIVFYQLWAWIISKIKKLKVYNIQIYLISLRLNRKKLKKVNLGIFFNRGSLKNGFLFQFDQIFEFFSIFEPILNKISITYMGFDFFFWKMAIRSIKNDFPFTTQTFVFSWTR